MMDARRWEGMILKSPTGYPLAGGGDLGGYPCPFVIRHSQGG